MFILAKNKEIRGKHSVFYLKSCIYLLIFCLPDLKPNFTVGMNLADFPFPEYQIFISLT